MHSILPSVLLCTRIQWGLCWRILMLLPVLSVYVSFLTPPLHPFLSSSGNSDRHRHARQRSLPKVICLLLTRPCSVYASFLTLPFPPFFPPPPGHSGRQRHACQRSGSGVLYPACPLLPFHSGEIYHSLRLWLRANELAVSWQ